MDALVTRELHIESAAKYRYTPALANAAAVKFPEVAEELLQALQLTMR